MATEPIVTEINEKEEETKVEDTKVETKKEETTKEDNVDIESIKKEYELKVNEYKAKLESIQSKLSLVEEAKNKFESKVIDYEKKELETLSKTNNDILNKFNSEDKEYLEKINTVKDDFIFPEEGKELSKEQIEQNIKTYNLLSKTGIFNELEKKKAPFIPNSSERKVNTIKDKRFVNNPITR